ncbi:APC family permease [Kitasatospora viridis]|uniref:Amino acid/polyamine/organocation transporter (APC superfamily) n=1 Tax=Kitasatospora viridis TaxID=281105 RepID=A0A561T636_9ACTN|nr:APC family permease [Kitasatospora viridis]TWF82576.1 amino acid/polyamine/organocation transporter (APC superfamily) [Kitasatospora viridis]
MSSTSISSPTDPPSGASGGKGLKDGALGLASSVAIGLASTAPAYSLAATLGLVVAGVGLQSPIVMILAFIPMLLIAYAYREMNAADPDCGTTFTWAARAFGPRTGWMGGWGIIAADVIVLANLAQIAGQYGFELIGANGLASSTLWTTTAGVVWIVLMTWLCYIGIEISAALQKVLLGIEVVMLAVLSVVALAKVYTGHAAAGSAHIALSWFNPLNIDSPSAFTKGILAAIFIYWGWDTAVSVNEETESRASTPGRAAVISTVLLLVIYAVVSTSAQAFAGIGTSGTGLANKANAGDVLSGLGNEVFGSHGIGWFLSKLLIFMVLTSSAASTQTSILPTARTTLSMAAHKAIPARFARIHAKYLTPTWSTVGMGVVSAVFYVVLSKVSTAVLTDSIGSIGLSIAFYYGLTGAACVWYYRRVLTRSARDLWFKGILPGLGALILFGLFVYAAFFVYADPGYGTGSVDLPLLGQVGRVSVIGIGSLLFGALVMIGYSLVRPAYFAKRVITVSAAEPS